LRGIDANTQGIELATCLGCLWSLRITLDERAQFVYACIPLVQLHQRQSFAQLRSRRFRASGEVLEDRVVRFHSVFVFLLAIGDLAQIKLGIAGQIIIGIIVQNIAKFRRRYVVVSCVVIP